MTAMVLLSEWMKSQVEFWRPIPGWLGYDVSNLGRVRSWRTVRSLPNYGGTARAWRKKPLTMRPGINKYGYVQISIFNSNGARKSRRVHQLVALAFIPNPEQLPTVNHLTGLRTDNRSDNLAWASRSEQSKHAWAYGLHKRDKTAQALMMVAARREHGLHLPNELIRLIRSLLDHGFSQGQIRRWSGMKATTIQSIAVGRTYRHVA